MQTWVFVLPVGKEIVIWDHDEQRYASRLITNDYANGLAAMYNEAIGFWKGDAPDGMSSYYAPVIKEHNMSGWRGGDIIEAKVGGEGDKFGLYLLINWIDSIWTQIENDETQHVSIGTVANYTDYKGRKFDFMIKELSLTENPRLKDIGKIQDTLSLRLVDAIPQEKQDMDEETLEMFNALVLRVEGLEAAHAELSAKYDELTKPADEAPADAPADAPDDMQAEDMPVDEEKIVEQLSDAILKQAHQRALEKAKGMRLGDAPAGQAPKIVKVDKLQDAKASGLTGLAAVAASFK